MFGLGSASLGVTLLILGLGFFLLTLLIMRVTPKIRPPSKPVSQNPVQPDIPAHSEAVLVIQPGGRISYANQSARNQFDLWEEEPNLERLARRSRPSDVFWGLCTSEGQAQFSIGSQSVTGTSYFVPNKNGDSILLTLRTQDDAKPGDPDTQPASQTYDIISALSKTMAADLGLETTLQSILESAERLIPTDFAEITIWDPDNNWLIPYRFVGIQGLDRCLEKTSERYPFGEGYSGYVATQQEPVLIPDVDSRQDIRPIIDRNQYPFRAYLGTPLFVGKDLIGTLELTALAKDAYTENDVKTLSMLSGQAAIALHNSLTYQQEQRRAEELSSLANLANAVGSARDFNELFSHLVEGISPLLDIEIAGFLIYDETRRILNAHTPFIGVPQEFVELYQVPIEPDSPAEAVWIRGEIILTENATEDPRLIDLGLDHTARAAGMRDMALIPLTSSGRLIGYLQAANKRDGTPFNQDDLRILEIIAGQAAPIIENADLIKQSVGRALRAEALRRIASLTGSAATLDEIFKYSLLELARLLQADIAGIFLLDESLGELLVHEESLYGILPEQLPFVVRLPVGDTNFRHTVTASKTAFISDDASVDGRVLPVFAAIVEPLKVKSVIDVPLIIRDRGFGEILLCSQKSEFFTQSDVQLAATVAGQLASAYERSQLESATDEDLRQRVDQLTALSRIGRELNTSTHLPNLLELLFDEAIQTTNADCGTILLFELAKPESKTPKISFQVGDAREGELLPLENLVLEKGASFIIPDFETPAEGFSPEVWQPAHEGVRSGLIVPIAYQNNAAGLIHLHAKAPDRFDNAALQIAQALAIQAAIAVGNAQRYQEQVERNELLNQRIKVLSNIFDVTQNIHLEKPLAQSLEDIAFGIQASSPFDIILMSVYEPQDGHLHRVTGAGIAVDVMEDLQNTPQPWADIQNLMKPEFCFGRSYFIPHDQRPEMSDSFHTVTMLRDGDGKGDDQWHPEDILIIPLIKPNGEPLGLISIDAPEDQKRPDLTTIETLEIFASQASLIIESNKQLQDQEEKIKGLAERVDEFSDTQKRLPILIQRDLENTQTIQELTQTTQRLNAGLDIIRTLNRQSDRANLLATLGQELTAQMGFDIALLAELSHGGPQLLSIVGEVPQGANPETLFGQRNPLHQNLRDGEILLVADLAENETWNRSPLLNSLETAGFVSMPITSGAGIDAAILAISRTKLEPFSPDDEQLFQLLSQQTAIAINNLNLITETGYRLLEVNLLLDFSRRIGSLDPSRILRILVDSALQVSKPAQAGMVTIFDPEQETLSAQAVRGYTNNDAMSAITFRPDQSVLGQAFSGGKPIRIDDVDFAQHYELTSEDLLQYRDGTGGILPISSLVLPIQSGDIKLGVLVLDNFSETAAFSDEDEALILSLTQQTALTLENARLYQSAEERAAQLQALSNVASTISSSLEPEELIDTLLDSLEPVIPYETGTLWLRDNNILTIRSARGFENSADLIGISTTTEDSRLFSEMIVDNRPISVGDVRGDSRFPALEAEHLSWLGIPLIAKGEMAGVIALEKREADFYSLEHIQVASTFASQAAVALENAQLYQQSLQRTAELDQRSQRLALLNRFSNQISSVLDPDYILQTTMDEIMNALPGSLVSAIMWEDGEAILDAESPVQANDLPKSLPMAPIFERLEQSLGVFNTQDVGQEAELGPLTDFFGQRETVALLILPLVTGDALHGFFLLHNNQKYRYSAGEIELARILTNQAAVAVQNAISFARTTRLTEELEQRVADRTNQLAQEHHRAQSLLRIMRELSGSLDLDHVLNRTLDVLNETLGAEQSTILLARPDEETFYYRASLGYSDPPPMGGRSTALKLDEGLAGWVINNRQSVLLTNILEDSRWIRLDMDLETEHRSAIAAPLIVGAEALGAILLFHRETNAFTSEDKDLAQAAAMQMGVAINNTELFNLIRDQAEDLGSMLRSQQVEASRSRAILEAVADGVLVTDTENRITLFNESAHSILQLDRDEVIGQSLDAFTGLFGKAAQTWMNTIRQWSQDPTSFEAGESYAEQITLDDKQVVSIHLAPVVMGSEFLGSVSIFRDITHQVEVDRLKSEFVATVSHELRTPMTSIKGYVEVLLMGAAGQLTEQQTNFLDIVKSNTERLNILVNDLLDVSRIEAGKVELSIQPLDIRTIVAEVIEHQKRIAKDEEKPMTFDIDLPSDLPRIPGDEERVRQILGNLVSNAYLYTPANGQVTVRIRIVDEDAQFEIQDNGIGIQPEDQERIFERFFRGEDPLVLASSGTGLGLSIVQQLIKMHHGRLWLESSGKLGQGSTFYFTLPLEHRQDAPLD